MDKGNYSSFTTDEKSSTSTKRKICYICAIVIVGTGIGTLLFWLINGESFKSHDKGGEKPDFVCSSVPDVEKFDCHPDRPISKTECLRRGCCYIPASDLTVQDLDLINSSYLGVPSCFFSKNFIGYEIGNITKDSDHIETTLTRKIPSGFPNDIQNVHLNITFIDDATLRIRLTDEDSERFEPDFPLHYNIINKRNELYSIELDNHGLLSVKRKDTGTVIFRTKLTQLVFSDQFLHLSSSTSSTNLYGLGEQKEGLLRSFNWARYTIFNQGDLPVPHRNLYGSHPFYMVLEDDGKANGVFLLNSNAMGLYGYITEYDLESLVPKYQLSVTSTCPIWCMKFDYEGKYLAVGNEDGHVVLHHLSFEGLDFDKKCDKQEGCILCLDWHKDGQFIVTGSIDAIRVWNVNNGHVVNRIILARASKNVPTVVWCIAVTSDMTIISGDSCGKTSFWGGNTGTLLSASGTQKDDVLTLVVNKDEDVIYTSGVDPTITMYLKSSNGMWLKSIQRVVHTHDVRGLQFVGDYLVSGGDDCNLIFTKYPPKTTIKFFPFCQKSYCKVASNPSCILLTYPNFVEVWSIGTSSDAVLQPAPAISLRPIGGILDLFIMLGPTPADVVKQYTGIVGRPFMIPYWSLGFHLCRYGYGSLAKTNETLQRNLDKGVPIDVQWHDIDYMNRHLTFTYDPVNFKDLPKFVDDLHKKGMHYVGMFSPGVSNIEEPDTYPPYDDAAKENLFLKDVNGSDIEAEVWNTNYTVFPDFSNPATPSYWAKQFKNFHSKLNFDGAWLDMNEPLNFMNGSSHGCPDNEIENPKYLPGRPYPLRTLTVCMTAKHHSTIHYNEHNLVAFREAKATFNALKEIRHKRPFIISRASFAGQGVHSGHWSGDITSNWEDMRYTIPSMLLFNMYGMPMIGSDICGFRLNTSDELCTRWQALGAFYPFSRNHNDFDTIEQDPAKLDGNVLKATIENLHTRYYLLPYFYTLFHRSHAFGETTVRPIFFEFPSDTNVYNLNEEFLWGPALLILPVLYKGKDEITPYYPKGVWYDFYSGEKFVSKGQYRGVHVKPTEVKVDVRGGYILPLQLTGKTTTESRKNAFDLLVVLNENQEATGELYWDDGDSLDTYENGLYNEIKFSAKGTSFKSTVSHRGYNTTMPLYEFRVYGIPVGPSNVTVNGKATSFIFVKGNLKVFVENYTLLQELTIVWT